MPKAILEFNLPEEQETFDFAVNGHLYYVALLEFQDWLRRQVKYGQHPDETLTIYKEVRIAFSECVGELLE